MTFFIIPLSSTLKWYVVFIVYFNVDLSFNLKKTKQNRRCQNTYYICYQSCSLMYSRTHTFDKKQEVYYDDI